MIPSLAPPASRRCWRRSRTGIRQPRSPLIEGVLLLDKPAGLTSHDAISSARRALGTRRIGHLGTLDPFATGLLVLLVGRVTRLAAYMEGEPKVYDATIAFGTETDTDDLTGKPTRAAPLPARSAVDQAMTMLTGSIEQTPPAFSAKQVAGVRAYAAARRGTPLELRSVRVDVHAWTVREWRGNSELDVTITCGGGTYIRALARDLGRRAASAAYLSTLRRTRSGPFEVRDAVSLDGLVGGTAPLRSPREALSGLRTVVVGRDDRARIARGQAVRATALPERPESQRAVLIDESGAIVAIAERLADSWAPKVVLADA